MMVVSPFWRGRMQGPAELLHLSDDILLSIVEEAAGPSGPCPSGNNRLNVALVCHRFAALVRHSPRLWAVARLPVSCCAERLANGGRAAGQLYVTDLQRKGQFVRRLHLDYRDIYSRGSASSLRGLVTQLIAAVPLLVELRIESIPETAWFDRLLFTCPTTLAQLSLSSPKLTYLPLAVSSLPNLTRLDFSLQSPIAPSVSASSLAVLGQLTNLRRLWLSRIAQLPAQVSALEQLTQLQLSWSSLEVAGDADVLSELGALSSLKELRFLYCELQAVPASLGCLVSLTHLSMVEGYLHNLPASYRALSSLTTLPRLAEFQLQLFDGRGGSNITSLAQLTSVTGWNRRR